MRAVDTNVVVRYLVNDDPDQAARARSLIEKGDVWVSWTVLLETGWVLRSVFGVPSAEIVAALRRFLGVPTVAVDRPTDIRRALTWHEQGMDLADALHLAACGRCEAMMTFDIAFAKAARRLDAIEVRTL